MKNRFVFSCISSFCMVFAMHAGSLFAQETPLNLSTTPPMDLLRQDAAEKTGSEYNNLLKKGDDMAKKGDYGGAVDCYCKARASLVENGEKAVKKNKVNAWISEIKLHLKYQNPKAAEKALQDLCTYLKGISEFDLNKVELRNDVCHPDTILFFQGRLALLKKEGKSSLKSFRGLVEKYQIGTEKQDVLPAMGVGVVELHYYYGLALEINEMFQPAAETFKMVREAKTEKEAIAFQAWEHEVFCRIRGGLLDGMDDLFVKFGDVNQDEPPNFTAKGKLRSKDLLKVYCDLRKAPLNAPLSDVEANTIATTLEEKFDLSPMQQVVLCDIANILLKKGMAPLSARIYRAAYDRSSPAGKSDIIAPWLEALRQSDSESYDVDFAKKLVKKHIQDFKRESVSPEAKAVAAQTLLQIPDYKSAVELYSQIFHVKRNHEILQNGLVTLAEGKNEGQDRVQLELMKLYYADGLESPEAKEDMGFYYSKTDRKKDAAMQYESAGNSYANIAREKKLTAYKRAADLFFSLQDLDSLNRVAGKILSLDGHSDVLYMRGELAKLKGKRAMAHRDWERFANEEDIDKKLRCKALIANGMLYFEEGGQSYTKACDCFDKIISNGLADEVSDRENVFFGMVLSAIHSEDVSRLQRCRELLATEPFAESHTETMSCVRQELAMYYLNRKDEDTADKIIDEALTQPVDGNQYIEAIICKLKIKMQKGERQEAINVLNEKETEFKGKPNVYRIYYQWGNLLKEQGLYEEAAGKYQVVENAKPLFDDEIAQAARGAHGDCLFAIQKYEDAQNCYQSLIHLENLHKRFVLMTMYKCTRCKQLKNKPDEWKSIAEEYLKIIDKYTPPQLKNYPADIFWTMKAFDELREIIKLHAHDDEVEIHGIFNKVQRKINDFIQNGICSDYLKSVRSDMDRSTDKR